jgi:2-oxoglutarate dehydrogenase E1 component
MPEFPDYAQLANVELIEELYGKYLKSPEEVDPSWRHFFEGIDFGAFMQRRPKTEGPSNLRIRDLVQAYRRFGHLQTKFNPLEGERFAPELNLERLGFAASELDQVFPTLGFCGKKEATLREIIEALKAIYCGPIGFEILGEAELEKFIQQRLEPKLAIEPSTEEKHFLIEYLNKAEILETFLHTKYVGQTRFSLEGAETMIPLLAKMIERGAGLGVEEFLIGMAHRGRLNVLTNILNKPIEMILEEFEDDTSLSFSGNDDVRYHMGFVGKLNEVVVGVAANPSHLESVDPVVIGQVYAKQLLRKGGDKGKVAPILIHGDASVAGQGVVYESLQLMNLPSYSVGGTIHLVVNNQIGYTTLPEEGRSTRYCTDIAKAFNCPVFHVNAEDPESCLFVANLAIEIRQKFKTDVFIDLVCYRKYGHNEGDEPSFTQPVQYKAIRSKKTIRQMYAEKLGVEAAEEEFKERLQAALAKVQQKGKREEQTGTPPRETVETAVAKPVLQEVLQTFCKVPEGFHLHPKLQKWLSDRAQSLEKRIDWSTGECLAIGSLLKQGVPVRLAGQDSQRGTFSQRHMVWIDTETGKPYRPLNFEIVNSPLSEFASMGFELGYTWSIPEALVMWEAQYGDFDNGAQIVIDQYVACAEQKWNCPSRLTLLLPHGYEGAGPEHSSARIERFLQLAASSNIQVTNPTTPAQYFHLLRRQALQKMKKPLIVFTPKSLLRAPACTSAVEEFAKGTFQEVLNDPIREVKKVLFCSGKIFYDLLAARKREDVAIIRIEQLYPFPREKIGQYKAPLFWVQEEPENMGAWRFIKSQMPELNYIGRPENATTATGSSRKHKQEQAALLEQALSGS